ncbi:bystin domain-containing protein [Theileria equi strain WA]|uniref:Bystin domain-containing protein n=1 Tax=Theileria equi strain WA TaxID=1537102 RepID=L0AZV2_THEEQ|nr:bystin domain-containing protein [Theileria equi strain WA]AFZ81100.1 bystin domain-containing protein [Theileria equi strain WA]|eukprot:XP_004830766.1 bystin domain-containing protein [Theileria equi strain WA]
MKSKLKEKSSKKTKVLKVGKKNSKKSSKDVEDSDLSDFEAEYLEELPPDVSSKIQKLIKASNDEVPRHDKDPGLEFLESDPLINLKLSQDVSGFLPENKNDGSTVDIWWKLKQLSEQRTEDDALKKIRPVYTDIGLYLSKYKSGSLPKAFKVLPKMKNWMELLELTTPQNWTPNAVSEATRLFSSNMNEANAEIFYTSVLLPAFRQDLRSKRTLNYHLYMALKKAMFKPNAWFKGILLPLVEEGCTYREAAIVGSVLKKISIPVLHASAFILRSCQCQKWFGSTSFILCILFQKKFNLPAKVIDGSIAYFYKFLTFGDSLPVIWHQSLYIFVENYKHTFKDEHKECISEILQKQRHPQITAAIESSLRRTFDDVEMYD